MVYQVGNKTEFGLFIIYTARKLPVCALGARDFVVMFTPRLQCLFTAAWAKLRMVT